MNTKSILIAGSLSLLAWASNASTINYLEEAGTAYQTPAMSTFTTTGGTMAGMEVLATFSDGSVQQAIWGVTGTDSGSASVNGYFTISESGNTFTDNAWTLKNLSSSLSLVSFTLLGAGGNTTFDRTFGGKVGTLNSALGKDFAIAGNYSATVTYSDILNLTGAAAVGDEYVALTVAFASGSYFTAGSSASFTQDADNAVLGSPVTTVPDGASTGLLMGVCFMALAALKRQVK